MKKRIALLLAALMLLAITACSAEKPASESPLASQEPAGEVSAEEFTAQPGDQALTIGLSMYTLEYPFYVTMCDAFEAACEEKGWTCITTNASTDASTQLNNCLDLLNKDIDALVLTCLLYTSPSPRDRQKSRMPSSA